MPLRMLFPPMRSPPRRRSSVHYMAPPQADLLDDALVHDDNGVRHGESLFLIVGHVDEGDLHLLLDALDSAACPAQTQIEALSGLRHSSTFGRAHQSAGDRHAPLLAAGERCHLRFSKPLSDTTSSIPTRSSIRPPPDLMTADRKRCCRTRPDAGTARISGIRCSPAACTEECR